MNLNLILYKTILSFQSAVFLFSLWLHSHITRSMPVVTLKKKGGAVQEK